MNTLSWILSIIICVLDIMIPIYIGRKIETIQMKHTYLYFITICIMIAMLILMILNDFKMNVINFEQILPGLTIFIGLCLIDLMNNKKNVKTL